MDSRSAAHVLSQIAALVELQGGTNRFKARAYRSAARALLALDTDDLRPLLRSGELHEVPGIGPATLGVLRDLIETGESRYLEQLRESIPEGVLEMLRVPGLGLAKIRAIHHRLGIETMHELEEAARDGRLAGLPRFGPKTAEKILKGIAFLRETVALELYPQAAAEAARLVAGVRRHPEVERAEIAGSVRRRREVIGDIDVVAACRSAPARVAASFTRAPGVRDVVGRGESRVSIRYVDGTRLDLHCVTPPNFAVAWWRATGSETHLDDVRARAATRGLAIVGDTVRDGAGTTLEVADEQALYELLGLEYIPPELREGAREVEAAGRAALPTLVEYGDIRGVLHCHSRYSDGSATVAELADAARARGWSYLGISDHSESAAYAGGLTRDAVSSQHDEIDRVNESLPGFRVLKGIEADILADGRIDYDETVLGRFDYVIGSIHSRYSMDGGQMTRRVLAALDDPHLTILGHPTGRLLLTREPYEIDMEAVLEKAGERGVAVELNADPHRLDIDWRLCPIAKRSGVLIEIGPDAHSTRGLDNVEIGVGIARKGWLEASDVLNARSVDDVIALADRRRTG
jgi:DNA polymerase (family 10)